MVVSGYDQKWLKIPCTSLWGSHCDNRMSAWKGVTPGGFLMEHLWWYPTIPFHDLYHMIIAEYSGSPCVGTIIKQPEDTKLNFPGSMINAACATFLLMACICHVLSTCNKSMLRVYLVDTWWYSGLFLKIEESQKSTYHISNKFCLRSPSKKKTEITKSFFGNVGKYPSLIAFPIMLAHGWGSI